MEAPAGVVVVAVPDWVRLVLVGWSMQISASIAWQISAFIAEYSAQNIREQSAQSSQSVSGVCAVRNHTAPWTAPWVMPSSTVRSEQRTTSVSISNRLSQLPASIAARETICAPTCQLGRLATAKRPLAPALSKISYISSHLGVPCEYRGVDPIELWVRGSNAGRAWLGVCHHPLPAQGVRSECDRNPSDITRPTLPLGVGNNFVAFLKRT
eukprot:1022484-Prymnesium_polylepis.2